MGVTPQAFPYSHLYIFYSYSASYFFSFFFLSSLPLFLHPSFCVGRRHVGVSSGMALRCHSGYLLRVPESQLNICGWLEHLFLFWGSSNGNWLPA